MNLQFICATWMFHYALSQVPTPTVTNRGSCEPFTADLLPGSRGLLVQGFLGRTYTKTEISLSIHEERLICESSGVERGTSSTVNFLVHYTCSTRFSSVCPSEGRTYYVRFTFLCDSATSQYIPLNHHETENRNVSSFSTARPGTCRGCSNAGIADRRWDIVTGCQHCLSRCRNVGLGLCTDTDSCCSWYFNNHCVHDCPSPYYRPNTATYECEGRAYLTTQSQRRAVTNIPIVCPRETVRYNCSFYAVDGPLELMWHISLPNQPPINISYNHKSHVNNMLSFQFSNGLVQSSLTVYRANQYVESIVLVEVNSYAGPVVRCTVSDLPMEEANVLLYQVPHPPMDLTIIVVLTTEINFIATVSFDSPEDLDEGFTPDFYQLSIMPEPVMQPAINITEFVFNVTLNYSTEYNISVTSVNCVGRSSSTESIFLEYNTTEPQARKNDPVTIISPVVVIIILVIIIAIVATIVIVLAVRANQRRKRSSEIIPEGVDKSDHTTVYRGSMYEDNDDISFLAGVDDAVLDDGTGHLASGSYEVAYAHEIGDAGSVYTSRNSHLGDKRGGSPKKRYKKLRKDSDQTAASYLTAHESGRKDKQTTSEKGRKGRNRNKSKPKDSGQSVATFLTAHA